MAIGSAKIAVVGPTAVGKTALALGIAERLAGEIISCDSVQVYRRFDIGAAKPTADERARVRHHLIDIIPWHAPFDAARFCELAREKAHEIEGRQRTPLICGGTGLYLRALRYGLVEVPPSDPTLRSRLSAEEEAEPGVLYERLRALDPESARAIEPHNRVQVIRALEIGVLTGESASAVRARHAFGREQVPMRVLVLGRDREDLRRRVARRSAAMVKAGLLSEVEGLLAAGVTADCRPMRSVGYREACAVVLGEAPAQGLAERISASTWHYAKRQMTWFRKERDTLTFELDERWDEKAAVDAALALVG